MIKANKQTNKQTNKQNQMRTKNINTILKSTLQESRAIRILASFYSHIRNDQFISLVDICIDYKYLFKWHAKFCIITCVFKLHDNPTGNTNLFLLSANHFVTVVFLGQYT